VGEVARWTLATREDEDVVKRSRASSPTQEPPPAGARIVAFLGVTTRASSITRIFPAWARACDLDLELRRIDLPLGSPAGSYGWTQALDPMVPGGVRRERVALFEAIANVADRRGT
jgi:hypothetical protein